MNIPKSIAENPYRILGVYADSPLKERTANASKLKAFLKVGKSLSFPTDFSAILPAPTRTPESVAAAEAALALPADRLRRAQFWFLNANPTDGAAFVHLRDGNVNGATEIWRKTSGASAVQNRMICSLVRGNLRAALADAELLYGNDFRLAQWVETVAPGTANANLRELKGDFSDALCRDAGTSAVIAALPKNSALRSRICEQAGAPIADEIYVCINRAKSDGKGGAAQALAAGRQLIATAGPLIAQLREIRGEDSTEYRTTADRLGLTVLQCAIEYYNNSDDPDAARNALELMKFAQATVAGTMARERCDENMRILQKNMAALPPPAVSAEASAINASLRKFAALAETFENAHALIAETQPKLKAICAKLGSTDKFYLKISTQVAELALDCVIASVNRAQDKKQHPFLSERDFFSLLGRSLPSVLRKAWEIIRILDAFHMEAEFARKRYTPNRKTLEQMCREFGIDTAPRRTVSAKPTPQPQKHGPAKQKSAPPPAPTKTLSARGRCGWAIVAFLAIVVAPLYFIATCAEDSGSAADNYSQSRNSPRENPPAPAVVPRSRENSSSSGASGNNHSTSQKKSSPQTAAPASSGTVSAKSAGTASKSAGTVSAAKSAADANVKRPASGAKPYFSYYDETGGRNYLAIKTHGSDDFAVIAQNHSSGKVVNHVYIHGGDEKRLYLPDGVYDIFVYSGHDWDAWKLVGPVFGGFSKNEHFQKDENLELRGEYCEYELFSDDNSPDTATADEAFPTPIRAAKTQAETSPASTGTIEGMTSTSAGTALTSSAGTQSALLSSPKTYSSRSSAGTASLRPKTGDTPYFSRYGIDTERGPNTLTFHTSGSDDCVVIVKKRYTGTVVGHVYIRGGDTGSLKVPNGSYDVFFYSGRDWDPHKIVGNVVGGFTRDDSLQKDPGLSLNYTDCTYTLYPVQNGNLSLKSASESEAF